MIPIFILTFTRSQTVDNNTMRAKPELRVLFEVLIAGSGPVILNVGW